MVHRLVKRRPRQRDTTVDRISAVPDTILWHILSFVPTKTAVMTSILSKRWKYMWTGVPLLDFTQMPDDDGSYVTLTLQQRALFRSFVDRVLLHNEVSSLEYLLLTIDEDCYFYLKSWLIAIAKREIAHIDIQVMDWAEVVPVSLSANFFTSKTLVGLELLGRFMVDVPWSLNLPNLEFAHLQQLKLPDDDFLKTLSSSCPKLVELRIVDCEGLTSTLHVESSTLKVLEVMWNMGKIKSPHACIVIQAPNLESLRVEENLKGHVFFKNELTSLMNSDIKIEQYTNIEYVLEFLRKVAGVKTLKLVKSDFPDEEARCLKYLSNLPIFKNLTCLRIDFGENLYMLLESAPMLKCLIVEQHVLFEDFPFESKPAPKCLSCLECVQFDEFNATRADMEMVAYFFKNAIVLKDAIIHMPSSINIPELKAYVFQELLMLPRSSAACQVKVNARSTCRYI